MLKSKALILGVVLAAVLLPAPPVHASELVKLAKLLVTGKRAPAAAEAAAPKPVAREGAEVRWIAPRTEERSSAAAPLRQEPNTDAMSSADWQQEPVVQTPRQSAPVPQQEAPRAEPAPTPSRGGGGGDRFEAAAARLFSRSLA